MDTIALFIGYAFMWGIVFNILVMVPYCIAIKHFTKETVYSVLIPWFSGIFTIIAAYEGGLWSKVKGNWWSK